MARRGHRPRRAGLHPHRTGRRRRRPSRTALAVAAHAVPTRDEPARRVRRGGRPPGVDEARGVGGGRGIECRQQRSPLPRDRVMLADDLRAAFLTSDLSPEQLEALLAVGEARRFHTGDELFEEGRPADLLWILLDGQIELSRRSGHQRVPVATMSTPGQWAGGLTAWAPEGADTGYRASARAASDGRAFLVPAGELSRLVGEWLPFA